MKILVTPPNLEVTQIWLHLYSICISIWLHLYCELHHAHEMQTSNTLKPKKHEQQLLTNTSTYGGIEPLRLAIPG